MNAEKERNIKRFMLLLQGLLYEIERMNKYPELNIPERFIDSLTESINASIFALTKKLETSYEYLSEIVIIEALKEDSEKITLGRKYLEEQENELKTEKSWREG